MTPSPRCGAIPWDISLNLAPEILTTGHRYEAQLAAADEKLAAKADDLAARLSRAEAHYCLDDQEAALADLSAFIEKVTSHGLAYQLRALTYACLGQADEAKQDLARFQELISSASTNVYLSALVAGYLGDTESAAQAGHAGAPDAVLDVLKKGLVGTAMAKSASGQIGPLATLTILSVTANTHTIHGQPALADVLVGCVGILTRRRLVRSYAGHW